MEDPYGDRSWEILNDLTIIINNLYIFHLFIGGYIYNYIVTTFPIIFSLFLKT